MKLNIRNSTSLNSRATRGVVTHAFLFPRDSPNKSEFSIRIRVKSGRLTAPSEQQLGQPATSERDAASATAPGRAGGSGSSGTSGPSCTGLSTTASDHLAPAARSSTHLSHESLHGK